MATLPSSVFNAEWYLQQNPDVAEAIAQGIIASAQEHFNNFGRFEGRASSPLFNPQDYLAGNPDVADAVQSGLLTAYDHFIQFGASEGRSPLSLFDPEFYLAQNPDVAAAVEAGLITATEHFLLYGQGEPRQVNPFIHLGAYLQANADLAQAAAAGAISPLTHLLTHGAAEGRDLGNGISLSVFADDPAFQSAVQGGNLQAALERVSEVAPFLPSFEPPAGWQAPADTPIPTDFKPPEGVRLVIPPSVTVPADVALPPSFEPLTPPAPDDEDDGTDEDDGDTGRMPEPGGGGRPPAPTPEGGDTGVDDGRDEEGDDTHSPDDDDDDSGEGPEPEPEPEPAPSPFPDNAPTYVFSDTLEGVITARIEDDIVVFRHDGVDLPATVDLSQWQPGVHVIELSGQTLELNLEQIDILSEVAYDNDAGYQHAAFAGAGVVRIPATVSDGLWLLGFSPDLELHFMRDGQRTTTVDVEEDSYLLLRGEHADGLVIQGDGTLDIWGWTYEAAGPLTLDVRTAYAEIGASAFSDIINVDVAGSAYIAGLGGGDVITLGSGERSNIIEIHPYEPTHYTATFVVADADDARSGDTITVAIDGENYTFTRDGLWNWRPAPDQYTFGLVVADEPDTVIVRSMLEFTVASGESNIQTRSGQQQLPLDLAAPLAAVLNEATTPSESYWSADGGTWDVVHGFDPTADGLSFWNVFQLSSWYDPISLIEGAGVSDGIAKTLTGDTVAAKVAALADLIDTHIAAAAFVHDGSTYIFHGDGVAGAGSNDIFVELVGVELESLDGILGGAV